MATNGFYRPCALSANPAFNTTEVQHQCDVSPINSEQDYSIERAPYQPLATTGLKGIPSTASTARPPPRLASTEIIDVAPGETGCVPPSSERTSPRSINHDIACLIAEKVPR